MTDKSSDSSSRPGVGLVDVVALPNNASSLQSINYQYPLKLVAPAPTRSEDGVGVQTLYLLNYGGGLVAGDSIDMTIRLDVTTRLTLLTQGSTKVFKSPSDEGGLPPLIATQNLRVLLGCGAGLCYLPDPVQPFGASAFRQRQSYELHLADADTPSLCALDWVSRGRTARGENWDFLGYASKNEVWVVDRDDARRRRLLLRDNLALACDRGDIAARMGSLGVTGTLILHGPMLDKLADYFRDEFDRLPRIGGRTWDTDPAEVSIDRMDKVERLRKARQMLEHRDGLVWTVSRVRNCTVVKFGAVEVEGGKRWLYDMLSTEGSVTRLFGERALLCLR